MDVWPVCKFFLLNPEGKVTWNARRLRLAIPRGTVRVHLQKVQFQALRSKSSRCYVDHCLPSQSCRIGMVVCSERVCRGESHKWALKRATKQRRTQLQYFAGPTANVECPISNGQLAEVLSPSDGCGCVPCTVCDATVPSFDHNSASFTSRSATQASFVSFPTCLDVSSSNQTSNEISLRSIATKPPQAQGSGHGTGRTV